MDFFVRLITDPVGFYQAHQLLVAQCGVNALMAISIWVTLYCGQLTMANVGFMAIGGYTSVILAVHLGTPLVVGVAAGCLLAGVVSLLIGLPVLRLRGVFLAIATIGFGEALRFGVILNLGITGKGQGLTNPTADPSGGILPVWVSVAALTYAFWRVSGSKLGRAWAAIGEDERAAASNGVDVARYKTAAFVIGAMLAAYAGALDTHLTFFVSPTEYAFDRAVLVLLFAVFGGVTHVTGPVLGAVVLTSLPEIVRPAAEYRDVVYGLILMLVVLFRPEGLVGRRGSPLGRRRRRLMERLLGRPAAAPV